VWMGGDAIDRGLCDGFGGLLDAVDQAKALAGLSPDDEVIITEYPPRRAFAWPSFGPDLPGMRLLGLRAPADPPAAETDYVLGYWRALAASKGGPLLRIPPEDLPPGWDVAP